jgi:hypothetical protein
MSRVPSTFKLDYLIIVTVIFLVIDVLSLMILCVFYLFCGFPYLMDQPCITSDDVSIDNLLSLIYYNSGFLLCDLLVIVQGISSRACVKTFTNHYINDYRTKKERKDEDQKTIDT